MSGTLKALHKQRDHEGSCITHQSEVTPCLTVCWHSERTLMTPWWQQYNNIKNDKNEKKEKNICFRWFFFFEFGHILSFRTTWGIFSVALFVFGHALLSHFYIVLFFIVCLLETHSLFIKMQTDWHFNPTVQHKKEFFSLDAIHSGLCGQITVNW